MTLQKELGVFVRGRLREMRMSRRELSVRLKGSLGWVHKLCGGKQNVTLATLTKLSDALECSVEVVFTRRF